MFIDKSNENVLDNVTGRHVGLGPWLSIKNDRRLSRIRAHVDAKVLCIIRVQCTLNYGTFLIVLCVKIHLITFFDARIYIFNSL